MRTVRRTAAPAPARTVLGRGLLWLLLAAVLSGCTLAATDPNVPPLGVGVPPSPRQSAHASAAPVPEQLVDVRPLMRPHRKYLGLAVDGAPTVMDPVTAFTQKMGKAPNLIEYYAAWGDSYNAEGARNAWQAGALTVMSWEPFDTTIAEIADGKSDEYIRTFARDIRASKLPVALSFADEFNGHWESWGTKYVKAEDYVRAWRHIHDIMVAEGAANVIWAWSPNVVNPAKKIDLANYYPGDHYVDWVGIIGYFTRAESNAFDKLYGPTLQKIRTLTAKPMIIIETASEPGDRKLADIRILFQGVLATPDLIGFVWFDNKKTRADWRLAITPGAEEEFRSLAADPALGFDVRSP